MTKPNKAQNITNTVEKELFDIVANLSRRLKIMPEDNSILLTYFNSSSSPTNGIIISSSAKSILIAPVLILRLS